MSIAVVMFPVASLSPYVSPNAASQGCPELWLFDLPKGDTVKLQLDNNNRDYTVATGIHESILHTVNTVTKEEELNVTMSSPYIRATIVYYCSIPGRGKCFPLPITSRPDLRPTQPPVQWVPGAVSPG
jgi:hypothetical protein